MAALSPQMPTSRTVRGKWFRVQGLGFRVTNSPMYYPDNKNQMEKQMENEMETKGL